MKKLILLLPFILFLLPGCSNSGATGNPKEVLTKFFKAISDKDIPEAKKYVTADSEGMINMMQMSLNNTETSENTDQFNLDKISIADAIVEGDEAKVPVTEKSSGETVNFILQKEKGDWKVAFDMGALARMAREKMQKKGLDTRSVDSLLQTIPKDKLDEISKSLDSVATNFKGVTDEQIKNAEDILNKLPQDQKEQAEKMLEKMKKKQK